MIRQYNLVSNKNTKTVHADSYLIALLDEVSLLKKQGVEKFVIEVSNRCGKVATYIRS